MQHPHLLFIRIRQNGPSSHLEQSMGQKPIDEGRQMASKIKVVKIGQYIVFPHGVVSFFKIKENGNDVFFFIFFFILFVCFGKSITHVTIKTNQVICGARFFPKPALLRGQ